MAFNDGNINFKFPLRKVGKGYFEGNKTNAIKILNVAKVTRTILILENFFVIMLKTVLIQRV